MASLNALLGIYGAFKAGLTSAMFYELYLGNFLGELERRLLHYIRNRKRQTAIWSVGDLFGL